jgi:UDP-sugar pyrophosphorylase
MLIISFRIYTKDTNGLAFHTLPLMFGVSEKNGFIMNSLTVPRKAKQAIGGIAKLIHGTSGEQR